MPYKVLWHLLAWLIPWSSVHLALCAPTQLPPVMVSQQLSPSSLPLFPLLFSSRLPCKNLPSFQESTHTSLPLQLAWAIYFSLSTSTALHPFRLTSLEITLLLLLLTVSECLISGLPFCHKQLETGRNEWNNCFSDIGQQAAHNCGPWEKAGKVMHPGDAFWTATEGREGTQAEHGGLAQLRRCDQSSGRLRPLESTRQTTRDGSCLEEL